MDRRSNEQTFHDQQARQRSVTFAQRPSDLSFADDTYLDHETWIRPAFQQLGDLRGLAVLDYGCGHGMASVVLARRGARVTAFDLSRTYLGEAHARSRANGIPINFVQADGERLPFADGRFDRVWGNAVLHHLDLAVAGRELIRVLRPGGKAVFCEPWGENPLLNFARRYLPYSGKERTPDERPLCGRQVRLLRAIFPRVEVRGYQLLAMTRRILRPGRFTTALERCDDWLLCRLPAMQHLCRYAVLTLHR
jgi:SAM-dependent methyltransferase